MEFRRVMVCQKLPVYNEATRQHDYPLTDKGEAVFHQWGVDFEELDGAVNFTVGVVEWPDGKVELVRADMLRFLEPRK